MNDVQTIPLPVLIAAVAALQAIKEADALYAFTLPPPLYMQLLRATSGLAYYTDKLAAEPIVAVEAGHENPGSWSTEEVKLLADYFAKAKGGPR